MEDVYTQVRMFCSSREGITDYVTLGFDELHRLADSVLSIRVIDLSEHDAEAWEVLVWKIELLYGRMTLEEIWECDIIFVFRTECLYPKSTLS